MIELNVTYYHGSSSDLALSLSREEHECHDLFNTKH